MDAHPSGTTMYRNLVQRLITMLMLVCMIVGIFATYPALSSTYAAISHIQLAWEASYAKAYQIQVSNDGTNWTSIYSTTNGSGGFEDFNVTGSGRYVRLNGTQRGTQYGYSLWEFGVYTH